MNYFSMHVISMTYEFNMVGRKRMCFIQKIGDKCVMAHLYDVRNTW
jgi:hypothetical protein